MKIIRYENPATTSITTTTTNSLDYNATTVLVSDASGFNADDILLLEEQGHEFNEIVYIDNISGNTITLKNATVLPHDSGCSVTKLNYDKYKIEKSSDGNNYDTLITALLKYNNPNNLIEYIDNSLTASDNMYYRVYYVNSITSTEDLQDTFHKDNNSSYLSIDTFRAETGFTENEVTDAEINNALRAGVEWIQDNAFNTLQLKTTTQDTIFDLDLEGMYMIDWNADGQIDKNDLEIYEYDSENNIRVYISHLLIKVFYDSNKLIFKEKVPRNGRQLIMNVRVGFKPYNVQEYTIKEINKLIATNYILTNVNISKIRSGVTSWTAGGTSVSRDINNLQESIQKNYEQAKNLLSQILKIYMKKTKLRTSYSSVNKNSGFGITTPSGRRI